MIIAASSKIQEIVNYIESVAKTTQPVLITGETGVGKEMIARRIYELSDPDGPFITVNVAGLDDNLFSDALFGHVTDTDTVRSGLVDTASGGTLFLDEIGALGLVSQATLLRLIQEKEYSKPGEGEVKKATVRIVAATSRDLWHLREAGAFREDLNYRIRVHHIHP